MPSVARKSPSIFRFLPHSLQHVSRLVLLTSSLLVTGCLDAHTPPVTPTRSFTALMASGQTVEVRFFPNPSGGSRVSFTCAHGKTRADDVALCDFVASCYEGNPAPECQRVKEAF